MASLWLKVIVAIAIFDQVLGWLSFAHFYLLIRAHNFDDLLSVFDFLSDYSECSVFYVFNEGRYLYCCRSFCQDDFAVNFQYDIFTNQNWSGLLSFLHWTAMRVDLEQKISVGQAPDDVAILNFGGLNWSSIDSSFYFGMTCFYRYQSSKLEPLWTKRLFSVLRRHYDFLEFCPHLRGLVKWLSIG